MIAVYDAASGELEELVLDLSGLDLEGKETRVVDDLTGRAWSKELKDFVVDWSRFDAELHRKIDREAGEFRLNFITDVPGQAQTYQRKEAEARAYLAAPDAKRGDYPFLDAEAKALGDSVADRALAVVAAADRWARAGAAIEGARMAAKRAVTEATTKEAKQAASAVDWHALIGD